MTDDRRRIEDQLDRDRAALAAAMSALRQRVTPGGLMREGAALLTRGALGAATRTASGNPLAAALTGAGMLWLGLGKRKRPTDAPAAPWMAEADALHNQADALSDKLETAARDGLLPQDELAEARAEVQASLARDLVRVMGQGLEALSEDERDAALAVREKAAAARYGVAQGKAGFLGDHPVLSGALAAAGAAALAAIAHRATGPARRSEADETLRDLRRSLDRATARLDAMSDRMSDRDYR